MWLVFWHSFIAYHLQLRNYWQKSITPLTIKNVLTNTINLFLTDTIVRTKRTIRPMVQAAAARTATRVSVICAPKKTEQSICPSDPRNRWRRSTQTIVLRHRRSDLFSTFRIRTHSGRNAKSCRPLFDHWPRLPHRPSPRPATRLKTLPRSTFQTGDSDPITRSIDFSEIPIQPRRLQIQCPTWPESAAMKTGLLWWLLPPPFRPPQPRLLFLPPTIEVYQFLRPLIPLRPTRSLAGAPDILVVLGDPPRRWVRVRWCLTPRAAHRPTLGPTGSLVSRLNVIIANGCSQTSLTWSRWEMPRFCNPSIKKEFT